MENVNSTPEQIKARTDQAKEREDFQRRLREEKTIEQVFLNFPSKFKLPPGEVLKAVGTIKFDADGNPMAGGLPLREALVIYGEVNPHALTDSPSESHDKGRSTVRSKADLRSVAEKVAFVAEFGEMAFSRLPLTAPVELDESTLDFETYRKLPVATKVKLIDKHGEGFAAKLKRAEQEQLRADRLAGIPASKRKA